LPLQVRFRNGDWHPLLASLKPIGLNLLLCNKCVLRDHGRGLATHLAGLDMQVSLFFFTYHCLKSSWQLSIAVLPNNGICELRFALVAPLFSLHRFFI